jgi:hypothetical protein
MGVGREMSKDVTLAVSAILDSWSILIEGGQGKGVEVLKKTMELIEESQAPSVKVERVTAYPPKATKLARILFEKARKMGKECLLVTNKIDELKDFRMYVGARDYGKNLNVSWYLTCEPGALKSLVSKIHTGSKFGLSFHPYYLTAFHQEELTAYVTTVHHCLLNAVDELMRNLGQDPSKIDRKSKGFLGVS